MCGENPTISNQYPIMKKIFITLICLISLAQMSLAQNPEVKQALGLKYLFVDYMGPNGGNISDFNKYTSGLEISYNRNINNFINLSVPLRFSTAHYTDSLERAVMAELGAQAQFVYFRPTSIFTPYAVLGAHAAYDTENSEFIPMVPVGMGFDVALSRSAILNLQIEYKLAPGVDNRNNVNIGLGFKYLLGKGGDDGISRKPKISDYDEDGVPDTEDLCPEVKGVMALKGCPDQDQDGLADFDDDCPTEPGLPEMGGCPDRDGDGVVDSKDNCPDQPGVAENNGCPPLADRDKDGVPDDQDRCPYAAGSPATQGCPDRDGDGIIDSEDACPTSPGSATYRGCPDSDGDGIHDGIDRCPGTPGLASNSGCPIIPEEDREVLEYAKTAVQFDTGKSTLKSESKVVLDQIAQIMRDNPSYSLNISGHTDSVGDAIKNLNLSESRAKACYDYLISKGIDSNRLSYVGFGETRPIASNETASGKRQNRRVEFEVKFK